MVTQLRRTNTAGMPDDFPLPKARYGFGASWDIAPLGKKIDIDLQCVVVDSAGAIVDCAYYNNLKAVRSITHSGDETTGEASGIDEQVWVNCSRVPQHVELLVFVLAAYKGGTLGDVCNGKLHVFEESERSEIATWDFERSSGSVDVVAAMVRAPQGSGAGWSLRILDVPARGGQHFMDILDLLAEVIRGYIPHAPARQKVAFAMEKGGIMDLPSTLDAVTIGLGWDTGEGEVDLDVSAILLDARGGAIETVFFGRLESVENGIVHSGDNLTGEGDGDDEQIQVNLRQVQANVAQVVFIINTYSPGRNFSQVANPYCRVVDNAFGAELCRYSLRDAGSETALIVAKIQREAGGRWGFHALGLPCSGRTWKDSLPTITRLCLHDTRLLMQRGGTADLGFAAGAAMSPPSPSAPPMHGDIAYAPSAQEVGCGGNKACSVM